MPQEIRVLKCFKCDIFQGDFVKKAKTWQCKICGEKQSIMQEFGRGTGKECRQHVQKLNLKMRSEELAMTMKLQNDVNDYYEPIAENVENLSKEKLMLPLLHNSNLSNCNAQNNCANIRTENFFSINYNTNANDLKHINSSNEEGDNHININLTNEQSQSNSNNHLNKYEKNLKRQNLDNADILLKKSKWNNYVTDEYKE